jgi:hypothetical protein
MQGQPQAAQYRGMQKPYEPVGLVQSYYGQNQQQQFQQAQQQPYQATATAYRPQISQIQPQFGGVAQQPFNQAQLQSQQQVPSPQAFHTANYRGNQLGHDQYLRADSVQPTSFSMIQPQYQAQQQAQKPYGQQIQQTAFQPQFQAQQQIQPQLLNQQPQQAQYQPQQQMQTNQFHTANYRGNQLGHDQYLRADSVQPAQPQVQTTMNRPSYIS